MVSCGQLRSWLTISWSMQLVVWVSLVLYLWNNPLSHRISALSQTLCMKNSGFFGGEYQILDRSQMSCLVYIWASDSAQHELTKGSVVSLLSRLGILLNNSMVKSLCIRARYCLFFYLCFICPLFLLPQLNSLFGLVWYLFLAPFPFLWWPLGCLVLSSYYNLWGSHQSEVILPQINSSIGWAHVNIGWFYVHSLLLYLRKETQAHLRLILENNPDKEHNSASVRD